jgi:putative SOS response-associated peptidase YedK
VNRRSGIEDHAAWLAGTPEQALAALRAYEDELLSAHIVSTRVNSPRNNGQELIAATGE